MKLRISPALRKKIEEAAATGARTMNAEIVARLEFTFAVELVVQESGWDVGHGLKTPEMKEAFVRHSLRGTEVGSADAYTKANAERDFAAMRGEIDNLRREIAALKG